MEDNVVQFSDHASIQDVAAEWIVKIENGELTSDEKEKLRAWINKSDLHKQIILDIAYVSDQTRSLTILSGLSDLPSQNVLRKRTYEFNLFGKVAAIALPVLTLIYFAFTGVFEDGLSYHRQYSANVNQIREIRLPDGTVATLNSGANVTLNYSNNEREIILNEGQANFEVVKDANRPFIVTTNFGVVRAVGTEFSVTGSTDMTEVIVTEGKVLVTSLTDVVAKESISGNRYRKNMRNEATKSESTFLKKGQKLMFNRTVSTLTSLDEDQLLTVTLWKSGMIEFDNNTLNFVTSEFARFSGKNIKFSDEKIGKINVSGIFNLRDLDGLLFSLEKNFSLKINWVDENTVILSDS